MLQAEQVLHNRYQLKHKLGQNAGRQTWLAEDIAVQPPESVVLKLLSFGGNVQWQDLKLFEREAQVLKQLQHPRIPQYRDFFALDDRTLWFGLVHEYIPGSSLKDLLDQGKHFTETDIRKIAAETLAILSYLHQLSPPVLHRDIKPSNLIWGEDEQIYLVDFGAVQDRAMAEGATFTVVGTYGYAPVEQFGGRSVPASDLYALGATLIHLATGITPADLPQRRMQIQFAQRTSLNSSLVRWIEKLVEPSLEDRLVSAEEALSALELGSIPDSLSHQSIVSINTSGYGLFNRSAHVPSNVKGWNWGAFLLTPFWALAHRVWLAALPGLVPWIGTLSRIIFIGSHRWANGAFQFLHPLIQDIIAPALSVIYVVTILMLAVKGNTWAWKSNTWQSSAQFKQHQRGWTIAAIVLGIPYTATTLWLAYESLRLSPFFYSNQGDG